jgi:hypothetical protein
MAKGFERLSSTEDGGRPVVASTFVTLDGYMVGPDEDISWVAAGFDREMQADIAEDMSEKSDVFMFGRVTYEIFAAYWPSAVPYEEGDELSPAAGKEDPASSGHSTTRPSWCSRRRSGRRSGTTREWSARDWRTRSPS